MLAISNSAVENTTVVGGRPALATPLGLRRAGVNVSIQSDKQSSPFRQAVAPFVLRQRPHSSPLRPVGQISSKFQDWRSSTFHDAEATSSVSPSATMYTSSGLSEDARRDVPFGTVP